MATNDEHERHKQEMQALKAEQDAKVRARSEKKGLIIVNTGDGKGKSTAAFGTAVRAIGSGFSVGIVQFVKGTWKTGEKEILRSFDAIDFRVSGEGFTWNTQDKELDRQAARKGWEMVVEMIEASRGPEPKYHFLVLDELNIALRYEQLPIEEVVEVLKNKPHDLHVMITGRDARPELIEIADTVTEMRVVKHAFEAGIKAQRGIEF